ncbi:MAG: T9SS type A sorting domain-containing protein [Saprospiraceae bacterium]
MKKRTGPDFISPLLLLLISICSLGQIYAQTVVFSDNFNTINSTSWTTSGQIGMSTWSVFRSGDDWGARRNTSPAQLECTNDVGANANVNGYVFASVPTTIFGSPYNTILSTNTGIVTWSFNMRQIRVDPAGFDSGNYGVAFILAGTTTTDNANGSGYAVVLGQTGSVDPLRLVSYSGGFNANSDLTNIIVSNTAGLTDFGAEYLSVKVTYNPCAAANQWQLFVRNDGTTSFADPLTGTLVSQGTATNSVNTGTALNMMAAYWQGSTGANQTAFFDNVTVSVTGPSIVLGNNPKPCVGSTITTLSYTGAAGGANQYSIDWDAAANSAGFLDINNASLPASPIPITIPVGAPVGTYNANFTVKNSTTNCVSILYAFNVQIIPCVAPLPSTMEWILLPAGSSNGSCSSSSDCTNDILCYGLEYTPLFTGNMTSYTTGFFVDCFNGSNPIISNVTCTNLGNNSFGFPLCSQINKTLFNSSANTGFVPVIKGVPQIIHQVCFVIPSTGILNVTRDNLMGALSASIDSTGGGGFESDTITHYIPLVIDSSIACSALPLRWLSFTATRFGELMSKLNWSTADEINVSHFEIQRSNDSGKTFHTIGTQKSTTEIRSINNYEFIDRYAAKGKNFYRLRQLDFDNRFDLSPIRVVSFTANSSFRINVWPNPVTDQLTIDIQDAADPVILSIVDISGRLMWKGSGDSGSSVQLVDVSSFGAGVYSLISESNTARAIAKIVVVR